MAGIGRKTDTWGSKFGFIMAAVGSSVGLGNFWRFPFTAGENGGGAFILIYIGCVILFGLPVLMAEYGLGRKSGMSAVEGFHSLARAEGKSQNWGFVGWLGSLASFFILTFYMVISAWVMHYIFLAFSGSFDTYGADVDILNANIGVALETVKASIASVDLANCSFVDSGTIQQLFTEKLDDAGKAIKDAAGNAVMVERPYGPADVSGCLFESSASKTVGGSRSMIMLYLFIFISITTFIVARGVKGGIERAATILMPLFFVLLLGIVGFALINGDAARAAEFLLKPDFSKVTFATLLAAVGQAFFSISVGSCMMITYGAYLSQDTSIPRSSVIVAGADTMVAMIAGFAIFPIVFAFGADPAGGPGLFFVALPIAFGSEAMPMGNLVGGAFFTLALFAALTSAISLMEVGVSWLEEREGVNRWGAAIGNGFVLFMIGAGYVYSGEFIDFADNMTGTVMLPLCGLLVAVFAGWIMSRQMLTSEFGEGRMMDVWRFACRWIVPPAVGLILIVGVYQTYIHPNFG